MIVESKVGFNNAIKFLCFLSFFFFLSSFFVIYPPPMQDLHQPELATKMSLDQVPVGEQQTMDQNTREMDKGEPP